MWKMKKAQVLATLSIVMLAAAIVSAVAINYYTRTIQSGVNIQYRDQLSVTLGNAENPGNGQELYNWTLPSPAHINQTFTLNVTIKYIGDVPGGRYPMWTTAGNPPTPLLAFGWKTGEWRGWMPLDMSHTFGPLLPGQSMDAKFVLNTGNVPGNYSFSILISASSG